MPVCSCLVAVSSASSLRCAAPAPPKHPLRRPWRYGLHYQPLRPRISVALPGDILLVLVTTSFPVRCQPSWDSHPHPFMPRRGVRTGVPGRES